MSSVAKRGEGYDIGFLRKSLLFERLSDDVLNGLLVGSLLQEYPVRTLLFRQGQIPDFLYVVLGGSLELFAFAPDGQDTIIEIIDRPIAYSLAPVLTGSPYLVSGRVLSAGKILMLRSAVLRKWVAVDRQLSLNLLGLLATHFREMVRQVKNLKLKSSVERLGCYIVARSDEEHNSEAIELPLDKRRLAARLGMTTVSLARAFARLGEVGVELHGRTVQIRDLAGLIDFCKPDALMSEAGETLRVVVED